MKARKRNLIASAALATLVAIAVLALAGVSAAGNGKGNGNGNGNGNGKDESSTHSASAAENEYGSAGKQYGLHKVSLCHNGHTIRVAQPAVKAHLRHGDKLGAC